ncbi:MAG: von Willebrand factor type A domain-containing protein [Nitrospinota bacterium]|nr:von Willebrand factor type A domain-containing protein [Nitrospinota bacterium]
MKYIKTILTIGALIIIVAAIIAITIPQFAAYRARSPHSSTAYQLEMFRQAPPASPVNGQPYPDMFFKHYGVNPTIDTDEENLSTFAADVDTASYSLARSYFHNGAMPPEEAIRVEEFVNYFDYGYTPPEDGVFRMTAEAFPSPTRKGYHTLVMALKGKVIEAENRKPANLVFVIDTSGSMNMENRLGLAKRSLRYLVHRLEEKDSVSIVEYGSTARVALEPTSGDRKSRIRRAVDLLEPSGVTNASAGISLGYKLASQALIPGGINALIVLSDGVANSGVTGADGILEQIKERRKDGITVSTIGFGMGNYNDILMEQLANHGDGAYYYVDRPAQAKRVFEENLTGALQVIARDVKLQVEFDRKNVSRFRLVGYENRIMTDEQFQDVKADAGEIGSGHSVTAIYEVKFSHGPADIGTLRVRYKDVDTGGSEQLDLQLAGSIVKNTIGQARPSTRLALAAAQFAEKLRGSYWVRNLEYWQVAELIDEVGGKFNRDNDLDELMDFARNAEGMDKRKDKFTTEGGWSGEYANNG